MPIAVLEDSRIRWLAENKARYGTWRPSLDLQDTSTSEVVSASASTETSRKYAAFECSFIRIQEKDFNIGRDWSSAGAAICLAHMEYPLGYVRTGHQDSI